MRHDVARKVGQPTLDLASLERFNLLPPLDNISRGPGRR
jgi:hypothetical protein